MIQVERALVDWSEWLQTHAGTRASLPAPALSSATATDPKSAQIPKLSRGYLPHYDSPELLQFVTFRLADSLPKTILDTLDFKRASKQITDIEYHRAIEKALDTGDGPTYLNDPRIARLIAEALLKFNGERYDLQNWVVMPNHGHVLFKTISPHSLSDVMHSIKGFTATAANKILGRNGRFWSPDYFDRFIRDRRHLAAVRRYIDENPVKAGLCKSPEEWPWGSAGWRG